MTPSLFPELPVPLPKVGDQIYVPTAIYIDRGRDDVRGGLATISDVRMAYRNVFVSVYELPGRSINYEFLLSCQDKLRAEFGSERARPDPDYGP